MYQTRILDSDEFSLWDGFVDNSPWSDILQMSGWANTKAEEGWKSLIIGVFKDSNLILGSQILYKSAGFIGNYAYVPHGLVFHNIDALKSAISEYITFFKQIAPKYNFFSLEIEPKVGSLVDNINLENNSNLSPMVDNELINVYTKYKFISTNRNMQPKYKLLYDLAETEDELLSKCQKTTRYNIRLAQKKGVEVNFYYPDDEKIDEKLKVFYNLMIETQSRTDGYPIRSLDSFQRLFKSFKGTKHIALFESVYDNQVLAMNISQRTKFWSSSFYAGSSRLYSELKPTYALRWQSVMEAKKYGSKTYDFWGIIPNSTQHSGYSSNKLSFGGSRIDYVGLLALTLVPWKQFVWDTGIRFRTSWKSKIRQVLSTLSSRK